MQCFPRNMPSSVYSEEIPGKPKFWVFLEFPRKFVGIFRGSHFPSKCPSELRCFLVMFERLEKTLRSWTFLSHPLPRSPTEMLWIIVKMNTRDFNWQISGMLIWSFFICSFLWNWPILTSKCFWHYSVWYHQAQAKFSNIKSFVRWLVSPRGMFSCRVQTTSHVVAFHLKYIGKCLQPKSLTWDICLD